MKTRSLLTTGLCVAVLFTAFDASARVRKHRIIRRPAPRQAAQPARPVAPKTLQLSGVLKGLNAPGKTLWITDDNTKSLLRLVITPQTKFIRDGHPVLATSLKTYEHVTVTYQDNDATVKEVKGTPLPGTPAPATKPKANQAPKKKA